MGIFSSKKENGKLVLVFFIGSSSVGGALFWTEKSGIPKIVFSIREPIALEKDIKPERFLAVTLKALETVARKVHAAGVGAPQMTYCVLSSLWHVSQTRIIKLEKNTPFIFTPKLAEELIQKEKALFEEQHLQKYSQPSEKSRLIELKNIKTMLNGYETPNPFNQKGRELEMTVFISMSGEEVLNTIEKTIKMFFHAKEIVFCSSIFSSFAVVRDMYTHNEDFLLINIGGEVTDISMIKKNILRELVSFPLGLNFVTRGVASVSNSTLSEAKSVVSLLKDAHATESVENKLLPALNGLKMQWLSKFQEALSNLSHDISVPATIYLVVDKEMADFFSETIKNEQFNQYTLTESKFKIIVLSAEVFHGMASFKEDIIRDPFLIINSVYINRFLINHVLLEKKENLEQI